jgi:hypothetical protein
MDRTEAFVARLWWNDPPPLRWADDDGVPGSRPLPSRSTVFPRDATLDRTAELFAATNPLNTSFSRPCFPHTPIILPAPDRAPLTNNREPEDNPSPPWTNDEASPYNPPPPSPSEMGAESEGTRDPTPESFSPLDPRSPSSSGPEPPQMSWILPIPTRTSLIASEEPEYDSWATRPNAAQFPLECSERRVIWFRDHLAYPYPPREFIEDVQATWHVTRRQIRTFFVNQRGRFGQNHPEAKQSWQTLTAMRPLFSV